MYRLNEQKSLNQASKEAFNSYIGRFLDWSDFTSLTPEAIVEATNKVLELSNIEKLEDSLVNYLQNSNQTRELILDAITKAKMILQNYEELLSNDIGIFKTKLEDLDQTQKKLSKFIQEANTKKNSILSKLDNDKKEIRSFIHNEYGSFGEKLKSVVDKTFTNQQKTEKGSVEKLIEVCRNLSNFRETEDKNAAEKIIQDYNETLKNVTRDYYTEFEANLKVQAETKRQEIYNHAYQNTNQILDDLKQEIGDIFKVRPDKRDFVFPALVLDSVIDAVEENFYNKRNDNKKVKNGGFCKDPEYKNVNYYSVNVENLTKSTKKKIDGFVTNGKKAVKDLLNQDIENMKNNLISNVDDHINKLQKGLNKAIEKRKTQGFNAQEEIVKLESEIELVKEKLTILNAFAQNI